jgi:hypothetical protein
LEHSEAERARYDWYDASKPGSHNFDIQYRPGQTDGGVSSSRQLVEYMSQAMRSTTGYRDNRSEEERRRILELCPNVKATMEEQYDQQRARLGR